MASQLETKCETITVVLQMSLAMVQLHVYTQTESNEPWVMYKQKPARTKCIHGHETEV